MGKGKRIREARTRSVDPGQIIELLLEVETQEQFLALIDSDPMVLDNAVCRRLAEMAAAPPGLVFKRWERLVAAARNDPVAAWKDHVLDLARDDEISREIGRAVEKIQEAERQREPARVIELAEPAAAKALEAELSPAVAILEAMRAHAFLNRPDENRQDNIDKAIASFGRALTFTIIGISIGTVLVAAGAACVIASLWPVRDDTTALLMTRLYYEMLEVGLRPPEALRRTQLWLRDLTDDELDSFLAAHPSLEREFRRRAALGDRAGVRPPSVRRGSSGQIDLPFSGPDYWAPFIAIGA